MNEPWNTVPDAPPSASGRYTPYTSFPAVGAAVRVVVGARRKTLRAALLAGDPVTVAMLLEVGIDRGSARAFVRAIEQRSLAPIRWS